jgi:type I restriction-modification system DNA methylase subunit
MIALQGQLFYNTAIRACLWFLARNKENSGFRDWRDEVLFIDARNMGIFRISPPVNSRMNKSGRLPILTTLARRKS